MKGARTQWKRLSGIGNQYENNLLCVVEERIRRYGSRSLAEYIVRSLL